MPKNVLLVQPDWPKPAKLKDPVKYWPFPLLKLAALYKSGGNKVHLLLGNEQSDVPFSPDIIAVTTVFSWWFEYVKQSIESLHFLYPSAKITIGGVHASLCPDAYRKAFPYALVHVGPVREAEALEPDWDLLPGNIRTQIISFSHGCVRRCSFCYVHKLEEYKAFEFEEIAGKIRKNRLILNDHNLLAHPDVRDILRKMADYKVNGRQISSCEVQGGFDVRILSRNLDIVPLMKQARLSNVRLAWDGGLGMGDMVKQCLEALDSASYNLRNIRCYVLYNHELPYEESCKKLEKLAQWKVGPIHSRFRPIEQLTDGYIPQMRSQPQGSYYIHAGWDDKKIRAFGSVASDISRLARSPVDDIDEVRSYYGKKSMLETLLAAA